VGILLQRCDRGYPGVIGIVLIAFTKRLFGAAREIAAAQWRGNEDYPPDFRAVLEDERLGKDLPWLRFAHRETSMRVTLISGDESCSQV